MTYATHRLVGALLFEELSSGWEIRLDEEAFLYGCVKPDVTTLFVRHPHFWKLSRKFVFKRIERLCRKTLKPGKAHRKFSEELGVILHYVADFFTAVHNLSPNPIGAHIEFERILHEAFPAMADPAVIAGYFVFRDRPDRTEGDTDGAAGGSSGAICRELSRRHARYEPDRTDPEADIPWILGASVFVAAGIMDAAELSSRALNTDEATRRPALLPGNRPDRAPRGSVRDIADFR